jgi:hypothetical protein
VGNDVVGEASTGNRKKWGESEKRGRGRRRERKETKREEERNLVGEVYLYRLLDPFVGSCV